MNSWSHRTNTQTGMRNVDPLQVAEIFKDPRWRTADVPWLQRVGQSLQRHPDDPHLQELLELGMARQVEHAVVTEDRGSGDADALDAGFGPVAGVAVVALSVIVASRWRACIGQRGVGGLELASSAGSAQDTKDADGQE